MQKVIKSHRVTLKFAFWLRSAKNVPRASFYDHIITTLNSDRQTSWKYTLTRAVQSVSASISVKNGSKRNLIFLEKTLSNNKTIQDQFSQSSNRPCIIDCLQSASLGITNHGYQCFHQNNFHSGFRPSILALPETTLVLLLHTSLYCSLVASSVKFSYSP